MFFFKFCEEHIADDNGWTYFSVCIQRSIICTSLWMKATFRHSEMLQLMLLIYWMKNILDMEHLFTWLHSKWWYIETCACTFLIYKPRQFTVLQHTGHWLAVGSKYMYRVLIMMLPLCWHTIEIIHPSIHLSHSVQYKLSCENFLPMSILVHTSLSEYLWMKGICSDLDKVSRSKVKVIADIWLKYE